MMLETPYPEINGAINASYDTSEVGRWSLTNMDKCWLEASMEEKVKLEICFERNQSWLTKLEGRELKVSKPLDKHKIVEETKWSIGSERKIKYGLWEDTKFLSTFFVGNFQSHYNSNR